MNIFSSLAGLVRVSLTCADPPKALSDVRGLGIPVSEVEYIDELSLCCTLSRRDQEKIASLAKQKGWELRILHRQGIFWSFLCLFRRPVLVAGMCCLLLLSLLLPGKILFVQVDGNAYVATNLILEAAAKHGICLGASGREIRSEKLKNALLEEIPQLQWAGVNAKGCVAVISVRERQQEQPREILPPVTNLVAAIDGIVQSVTATQGTPLCKPGDAVVKGQTLISGYSDLGICLHGTQAKGDVYGLTQRKLTAISPLIYQSRSNFARQEVKYALLLGNKRINFYKSSGILDASCARIYSVWYMTLPGGFRLPVGVVQEVWQYYDFQQYRMQELDLDDTAKAYLLRQLTDAKILHSHTDLQEDDSAAILRGSYVCREMIAQIQIEEN